VPKQATNRAAHAAGVVVAHLNRSGHHEIGGFHLAAAHVGVLLHLAGPGKRALLLDVLHGDSALYHHEALGVLRHHPEQRGGRAELIALEDAHVLVLRLVDGEDAERLLAFRELVLLGDRRGCNRDGEGNDAAETRHE